MAKRTLEFWVEKRFVHVNQEWALFCKCSDAPDPHKRDPWVLRTWTKDPDKEEVKRAIEFACRSMDFAKNNVLAPEEIQIVEYSSLHLTNG